MPGSGRAQISELLFTLLLFFVQVGLPLIGVQPSFAWGILVWAIIAALSVHLFLQCEVWRRPFKILGPIVIVGIIGRLVWSPLKRQYNLEHPIVIAQKPRQGGDRGGPASKKATEEIPPPGELKKPRKTVQFSPKKKKEDGPAPVDKSIHIPSEKSIPIPILQPTPTSGPVVVAPDSVVSVNQRFASLLSNEYNG
jgi:hypothetical protein